MDYNEIAIFLKVVQAGSFSRAARQLEMPNSTVSAKISSLEKRLGTNLIQRTTRRLSVTEEGQAYYQKCLLGFDEIERAENDLQMIQGEPQGRLRVTAPIELGATVLPGVIAKYNKSFPKVEVEVILADRRVDLISENVDLAIRAGELNDSSLISKSLGVVHFAPFAASKYLKAFGEPKHPKDLSHHKTISFTAFGGNVWRLHHTRGAVVSAEIKSYLTSNDLNFIKALALSAGGIVFLPEFFCTLERTSGRLVRVLEGWRSVASPIHFIYPSQKHVQPKLRAFIEMTTEPIRARLRL